MILALDFGITITDILRKSEKGSIEHTMLPSDQRPSENFIKEFFEDLDFSKDIELIALTGGHHNLIGNVLDKVPVIHVNEVDAIGKGGFHLSKLEPNKQALIVNSGSGTACILAKGGAFIHCSGTGVGGGTVLGLSKLLLGTSDPQEIQDLAKKGDANETDLILEDVVSLSLIHI